MPSLAWAVDRAVGSGRTACAGPAGAATRRATTGTRTASTARRSVMSAPWHMLRPRCCSPFGSARAASQAPQDVLHDPAVAVVVRLARGVDADDRVELHVVRLDPDRPRGGAVV